MNSVSSEDEGHVTQTNIGMKGSDIHTHDEVGDTRVVLSALLVRGADTGMIQEKLKKILDEGHVEDAFVLAFMNRNIRGGKGERDLFYEMYSVLLRYKHDIASHLLDLVPHFGYWGDMFEILDMNPLEKSAILELVKKQLIDDEKAMGEQKPASLLAKWIPREGNRRPFAKEIAAALSSKPLIQARLADYRKRISALNKYISTTEIAMCANTWDKIVPEKVPGRCMKLHTKAFLNEQLKGTGLRKPDDKVRLECREHFQTYFSETAKGTKVAKGANTLYPHEIVNKVSSKLNISSDERNSLIGSWNAFVVKAKEGRGLGRSIPMCDFSGSMGGLPLEVSRALGLLISEVTIDAFKHKMLTFDSKPKLVDLPAEGDIFDKVEHLNCHSNYGQGLSTDFQKAMDLVLDNLVKHRVPVGEEPENIIVLTDMAWDAACGSSQQSGYTNNSYTRNVKTEKWQTHIQMIRENFKRAGEDMFGEGKGYKVPRIVIWNLSASCNDMHAKADEEGVVMLSGWSPSLFKVLMAKGVEIQTPYKALRYQLDDEMYDVVRERIQKFKASTSAS